MLNADAAVARIAAVAAGCLLIGERLGLGPPRIEFERARLYAVDPAGFGAMAVASTVSILAFPRLSGTCAEAVSTFIAAGLAPVL
ncbi:hypothetical protein [Streptomyces sp. NPDC006463]|uniref:hypothetical protein n=1 Tax=Streptomyces sp. NPDC006463 TaxID=3364746 RepID=UPI00368E5BED